MLNKKNILNISIINFKKNNNYIPCIIYNKYYNKKFYISLLEINKILKKKDYIIYIKNNNKKFISLIKDIQYNALRNKIIHIDFYKIIKNKSFKTFINIKTKENSIGVSKGGFCYIILNKLKIKTKLKYYNKYIYININNLDIGDKIFVKDIVNYNKNIKILNNYNNVIITIKKYNININNNNENSK
ncbi:MAG: hypothetical protein RDO_0580 [Flavobacteriales endosymbiont of Rhyzopertha dominica]|nr:MAG: 50S ribosomal protein L25 [Candidatus Shikimatogenerans bostrichidophilus]